MVMVLEMVLIAKAQQAQQVLQEQLEQWAEQEQ